jgi:nicotinate-nucleotide pyrophosphorylase (carboxylating)
VKKAKSAGGFSVKIEVECQNLEEAEEAIRAGADIVMLDNMKPTQLRDAARKLKAAFPHALIEGSGGITLETLPEYFIDDVDVLSMGNLTQGVPHIDFSLKIDKKKQ